MSQSWRTTPSVDYFPGAERPDLPDEALQILARHKLHREEGAAVGLAEVEQPAHVAVRDAAGQLRLARKALDRVAVRGHFVLG